MSPLLLFAAGVFAADVPPPSPTLQTALEAELSRASGLRLPDAPGAWSVTYDVLDGPLHYAAAEDGALYAVNHAPHRMLRAEVRVGDATVDSSNFSTFGGPEPVQLRALPEDDVLVALRREIWMATDAAYKGAVEVLSQKQAARRGQKEVPPPDFELLPAAVRAAGRHAVSALSGEAVEAMARALSDAASVGTVEAGQAEVRDWHGWHLSVGGDGTRAWRAAGNVVVRVQANVRRADGTEVRAARWWVERDAAALPPLESLLGETRAMTERLLLTAAAPDPEPWLGPVLFEGPAATELFSQLLAPELVGTRPEESGDDSLSTGGTPRARLGRRLLPEGWKVWDDPSTKTGVAGEYELDHEGVVPRRVDLVVDGVVKDLLMSRIPGKERVHSTGHGRSLSNARRAAIVGYTHVAAPRPLTARGLRARALRLAAGAGLEQVLVIERLTPPAMVEGLEFAMSGDAPLAGLTAPYEACLLDRTGACAPVRNLRFVGVDRRALRDIVAAGPGPGPVNQLDGPPGTGRYTIGTTGGVPTTWNVPSVLVSELELEPAVGGEPRVITVERGPR
jgi:hypothetical protein